MCSLGLFPPHRLQQKLFQETRDVFFGVCWIFSQQYTSPESSPSSHYTRLMVSQVSHTTMEPSTAFTFSLGDSVELLTEEQHMQCNWQISAIQGNTIRITKCDLSDVREVNCSDFIYMLF